MFLKYIKKEELATDTFVDIYTFFNNIPPIRLNHIVKLHPKISKITIFQKFCKIFIAIFKILIY